MRKPPGGFSLWPWIILLLIIGCRGDFSPKPKGFNRFIFPEHAYQTLPDTFPYFFEYSAHARLLPDTAGLIGKHWVEVHYPDYKATIHITYKPVNHNPELLKEYLKDAYVLTAKHQIKAYGIDEIITITPKGKTAVLAELEGEVPSQFQFFTTDSTHHFLRGALYFFTQVQNDSLAPAIDYIKKDMVHMLNTLEWIEAEKTRKN